jgi:hypothetical protein
MTVLYFRERGPICYKADVFFQKADFNSHLSEQLFSVQLDWCWESVQSIRPTEQHYGNNPTERPLTQLTPGNTDLLVRDIRERDLNGYGRYIALFGVNKGDARSLLDENGFRVALETFCVQESGQIKIAIVQVGDLPEDLLFTPHALSPDVSTLLNIWGIVGDVPKRLDYRRLRLYMLEALYPDYRPVSVRVAEKG